MDLFGFKKKKFTKLTKQYALEIWKNSDQSTQLKFSDETGFENRTCYSRQEHTIFVCPNELREHFQHFKQIDLTYEEFVKFIVAHELAHSVEKPKEGFPMSISGIVVSQNPKLVSQYRKFVLQSKFKQEAFAWKNSRKFLDSFDKKSFYLVARTCLRSYYDYEDIHFEKALIDYRDSMNEMFARSFLDL